MRIGIAGFGFMGQMHYGRWMQMPKAQVVNDSNEIAGHFRKNIWLIQA